MNPTALALAAPSWAWLCFLLALAVVVVLRFKLPPERRRRLRGSLLLLSLYVMLSVGALLAGPGGVERELQLVAAFVLTLAAVHVAFVLVFDGLGRGHAPRIVQDVLMAVAF